MRLLLTAPVVLLELLACAIRHIEARTIAQRVDNRDRNTTLPAPIIAEPSQSWEGVDGIWSTFVIRVGTPSSPFRVLPATSWQETWVVYGAAKGVCNATAGVKADCQQDRGGVFDVAKSSSWKSEKQHQLGLNEDLGIEGVGQYGFDTVGLGFSNRSGVTQQNQVVAAIVSSDYWFGSLGLGFQPTNFSGYDDPQPSFTETLFTQGRIASRSWSYTAGAYYRLKSVFGSLIFGGYDASRFQSNNVTFTMAGDNLKDLIVTIRRIGLEPGGDVLMDTPEFAFIDSSVPEIWLPPSVCASFEQSFGLRLDASTGYYLLNSSMHTRLVERNPRVTFTLANQKDGGSTVDIELPYAAFDFNISAPLLPNRTERYFPLRRAVERNYILGRTFLQEAYVTAHYGDRVFNVSQCIFEDGRRSHVVALPERLPMNAIRPPNNEPGETSPAKGPGLSKGAIAGIVIGVLAGVFLLALLAILLIRRRRRARNNAPPKGVVEIDPGRRVETSLDGGKWVSEHGEQVSGFTNEVEGREMELRVELDATPAAAPAELPADSEFGERTVISPMTPTGMGGYGEGAVGRTSYEIEGVDEHTDTVPPRLTISSPQGTEKSWSPSSPVRRSGTSGSRFREVI